MLQLSSGTILGRYELLLPVARGGMAEVWAARLHGTRGFTKLVAVKTIRTGSLDDTRLEQMLLAEAQLASLIVHPNVISTLELGEQDETLFLVMEWADAEPLNVLMKEPFKAGNIPLRIAVNIIVQACRGAHCAHELVDADGNPLGVVHRDLSPQNVLLTYQGIVKLVDFGIAKATSQASTMTQDGEVKGKLAYMSPEQIRGESVDRRTDVFALGTMLYLMTTGQHPFKCANPAETMVKLSSDAPVVPPNRLVPDYPKELQAIVLKALHKQRDQRYETAEAMLLALEAAMPEVRGIEPEVAKFLLDVSAGKGDQRRRHIRTAGELLDRNQDVGATSQSSTSLSAVSAATSGAHYSALNVAHSVRAEHLLNPEAPPRTRKGWVIAGAALGAIALGIGLSVFTGAVSSGSEGAAAPGGVAAGQPLSQSDVFVPGVPPAPAEVALEPAERKGTAADLGTAGSDPKAAAEDADKAADSETDTRGRAAGNSPRYGRKQRAPAAATSGNVAEPVAAPEATPEPVPAPAPKAKAKKRNSWDPNTFGGRL